jgi:integrase/recombinase XerD
MYRSDLIGVIRLQQSANEIINQFSKWLEEEGKAPNTILTYQRELKRLEDWLQGYSIGLSNISKKEVQDYISFLESEGKSPMTNDKILGIIRTFAKFIKKTDISMDIKMNPITKKEEIEVLNDAECHQLLHQVKQNGNTRNIGIVYTLLHTGIRVSELCALNLSDVDFEQNQLTVNSLVGQQRVIPLSNETKHHLLEYCKDFNVSNALFISKSKNRLTERAVQYILKNYEVNPHKLRHTFCQRLVDKGISLEVISKLAGHKDINVTKRYAKERMAHLDLEEAIKKSF